MLIKSHSADNYELKKKGERKKSTVFLYEKNKANIFYSDFFPSQISRASSTTGVTETEKLVGSPLLPRGYIIQDEREMLNAQTGFKDRWLKKRRRRRRRRKSNTEKLPFPLPGNSISDTKICPEICVRGVKPENRTGGLAPL